MSKTAVSPASKADFFNRIFRFFASLPLAIALLVSLMGVLAAGTILESLHGAATARLLVYDTPWFSLLLFILGINVAAAALDRYPWKKKHTGFVITHLGIILILIGSLVSKKFMTDGQMVIAEGDTESRVWLDDPLLYFYVPGLDREQSVDLRKRPFPWTGSEKLAEFPTAAGDPAAVYLTAYYPKGAMEESITADASSSGPGAVRITLQNSFITQQEWLIEEDAERGTRQVGPATLRFSREKMVESKAEQDSAVPYLEAQSAGKTAQIPLNPEWIGGEPVPLGDTGYTVQFLQSYNNAVVVDNRLVEQPAGSAEAAEAGNPAVQLVLRGKDLHETHTVFANFPDFPTMHGMKPSQTGMRLFLRMPGGGSRGESHELRFVKAPSGADGQEALEYQIRSGLEIQSGTAEAGKEIATGWMDLKFRVEEYYPYAVIEEKFSPEPNNSEREGALPVIRLKVTGKDGSEKEFWLGQGVPKRITFAREEGQWLYSQRHFPAGFRLKLRDFRMQQYPGTQNPASYESDVTLVDDARGTVRDVTISMNQPLEHRGYKIYQSGYHLQDGQPDISIFSVGKNPGIPFQYSGTIVMAIGIIVMFFTRKYSTHAGKL